MGRGCSLLRYMLSGGAALAGKEPEHKKGGIVRYERYKQTDENCCWTGNYEWHYIDQANFNLVRSTQFLIEKI